MEKETANEREVFAISRDQVALWSLNRGMTSCLAGGGKVSRCRLGLKGDCDHVICISRASGVSSHSMLDSLRSIKMRI